MSTANQRPSATQRVVITGLGLVSPIGSDLETVWDNLQAGRSGITEIENLDTSALPFTAGGEVKDFTGAIEDYGPLDKQLQRAIKKNMKVMCREIEMGVAASQKALAHSGLGEDRDPTRCGCLFGCDYILTRPEEYSDGLAALREQSGQAYDIVDWPVHGLAKVNPLWLLKYLPNMPNSHVSIYNDFRGPNNSITMREASMNLSVAEAVSIIQRGAADAMLVGATGSRIHPLRTMQAFLTDRLASQRANPGEMCRPFDQSSDGTVVGEGAGALMLESLASAEARGAKIWGEIVGTGAAMVGPTETGDARDFMRLATRTALSAALRSAGDSMPEAWHIHAQGMGSPAIDLSEALAIGDVLADLRAMLGRELPVTEVPVTAAKSYFGNLGAGGAAVELICSLLALEHNQLFEIQNLKNLISEANWQPARAGQAAGRGFVHSSCTYQGQASSLCVAAI